VFPPRLEAWLASRGATLAVIAKALFALSVRSHTHPFALHPHPRSLPCQIALSVAALVSTVISISQS